MPRLALLVLAAIAACGPASRIGDAGLVGYYRFVEVNGQPAPAEFPVGSGAVLESGILELGDDMRFAVLFVARQPGAAAGEESGPIGSFQLTGDSLLFTPDGAAGGPPLRFRYRLAGDDLRLWDAGGNSWGYRRER